MKNRVITILTIALVASYGFMLWFGIEYGKQQEVMINQEATILEQQKDIEWLTGLLEKKIEITIEQLPEVY